MNLFPHRIGRFASWLIPGAVWLPVTDRKVIYLTFDDGPVPEITDYVLDTLKIYEAKAVFFCVGENVRKHPEVFRRVREAGHRIGNHTYNHWIGWGRSTADYCANTELAAEAIAEAGWEEPAGQKPLFRPPYGRISPAQFSALRKKYQIVMWDVVSGDFVSNLNPEYCARETTRLTRPGSVVVFHDSFKAADRLKAALPRLLEHFSGLGYTFEVL